MTETTCVNGGQNGFSTVSCSDLDGKCFKHNYSRNFLSSSEVKHKIMDPRVQSGEETIKVNRVRFGHSYRTTATSHILVTDRQRLEDESRWPVDDKAKSGKPHLTDCLV